MQLTTLARGAQRVLSRHAAQLHRGTPSAMTPRLFSTSSEPPVVLKPADEHGVRVLLLNRPDKLNNMDVAMGEAFIEAVDELAEDKHLRCVVLTGAGRAFSAGGDLQFLKDRTVTDHEENRDIMIKYYYRFLRIRDLIKVPILSAINGPAVGAGLCVATATDIRVVAEDARLGYTFATLGIHPGMGCTHFLPKVIGPQLAAKMLLTGELITGKEAVDYGLAIEAVPAADVLDRTINLAHKIAAASPCAVRATTRTLRRQATTGLFDALNNEATSQSYNFQQPDLLEGLDAVVGKRAPVFKN